MLTTLRIRNLALVADLTLELGPGLGVITGETGAGKSVILGALNLVLGQRADRGAIRAGADHCTVEAAFDVTQLRAPWAEFLANNGLEACEAGQLVLKRSFTLSGANRQFVNGSPTTLATLSALGSWLVDLHGPHEHQSLLQPARQLAILDAYGALEARRLSLAQLDQHRATVTAEKTALIVDEQTYAQQLDLLRFQVHEIHDARLREGEDVEIEAEHRRTSNAARLLELAQIALGALSEGDDTACTRLSSVGRALQELFRLDPTAVELTETHAQAAGLLRELQQSLATYADKVELDPARLAELEQRLDLLHSLKRKYGPSLNEVIHFGGDAKAKLALLEGRDLVLARLNTELNRVNTELAAAARALSSERKKLLPRLTKSVMKELTALGFRQCQFDVALTFDPANVGRMGGDTVDFQFAPNPGEPARPLRAIASSGELARVMLALKTVLAAEDEVPLLVFDEVDANVGGETANAVGEKMRQIARQHQVLCITHLAPVAAAGDAHYLVTKEVKAGRTESQITRLSELGRIDELARMLGGGAGAKPHAKAMLSASQAPRSE